MRAILAAFALGVLALQQQAELPRAWVSLPLALAIAALIASRLWNQDSHGLLRVAVVGCAAIAVGFAGFHYAAWRAQIRLADQLPSAWEGRDIEIVGIVDELPQSTDNGLRFTFAVERVETLGARVPSRLALGWYNAWRDDEVRVDIPQLHAGERWRLAVRLKRPHGTVNPRGFDVEAWPLENELRATGYVRESEANRRLDAFAARRDDYVQRTRESIRDRILTALAGKPYAA